jgi:RNA polymerase-binding transcription factor DksA
MATTLSMTPRLSMPAWRRLLEERWQQRLGTLTELALAYHDAEERGTAQAPQLRRMMREAVAARRALSDTEEALARLPGGTFGLCEQCSAPIPVEELRTEPETRYCPQCLTRAAW